MQFLLKIADNPFPCTNGLMLNGVNLMGKTKKDLNKQMQSIKKRIAELEDKARKDPLKKNKALHEELAKLKKKLNK